VQRKNPSETSHEGAFSSWPRHARTVVTGGFPGSKSPCHGQPSVLVSRGQIWLSQHAQKSPPPFARLSEWRRPSLDHALQNPGSRDFGGERADEKATGEKTGLWPFGGEKMAARTPIRPWARWYQTSENGKRTCMGELRVAPMPGAAFCRVASCRVDRCSAIRRRRFFWGGCKKGTGVMHAISPPNSLRGKSSDCSGPVRGGGAEPKNHCHVNDTGGRPPRLALGLPDEWLFDVDSGFRFAAVRRRPKVRAGGCLCPPPAGRKPGAECEGKTQVLRNSFRVVDQGNSSMS
jgi:hypothetical protein